MTILYDAPDMRVEKLGMWLRVNQRFYGFTMTSDEGKNYVVVHAKTPHRFASEYGFYIPLPLTTLSHLIEVRAKAKPVYVHYLYHPDKRQRILATMPMVFISLARLERHENAPHITRPRPPK
jgi:hypothetical protein